MTLKNTFIAILLALFAVLGVFTAIKITQINHLKQQLALSGQNLRAAQDSLHITVDKLGRSEADKAVFVASFNDLKKMNSDLAKEVAAIKGTVATIGHGTAVIVHDSISVPTHNDPTDSTIKQTFAFDTAYSPGNYQKIDGFTFYNQKTKQGSATLTRNEIGFDMTTGIKNFKEGKPEIFLKSNHPGFHVTSLSGAILDPKLFEKPKQHRISLGIQLGYSPLSYNLTSKTLGFVNQITLGGGLSYRLF